MDWLNIIGLIAVPIFLTWLGIVTTSQFHTRDRIRALESENFKLRLWGERLVNALIRHDVPVPPFPE